ncbi:unnamed protein product [Periconia digitata]|uniref:Uncharacterized protein n=1 Tax=Periconia digitata TaxID=1303443 RepID=A0A9W4UPJ0_9PLEO|nr:unnamed protein product [Periconia digitata]
MLSCRWYRPPSVSLDSGQQLVAHTHTHTPPSRSHMRRLFAASSKYPERWLDRVRPASPEAPRMAHSLRATWIRLSVPKRHLALPTHATHPLLLPAPNQPRTAPETLTDRCISLPHHSATSAVQTPRANFGCVCVCLCDSTAQCTRYQQSLRYIRLTHPPPTRYHSA